MQVESVRISAGVVVYGGASEAHNCICSVAQHTADSLDLYVIDNASPDGAMEKLEELGLPQNTQAMVMEKNKGYGAGHNAVMPMLKSKYHVVLNPDIILKSDTLTEMANWMDEHTDVVMATPKLLNPDGSTQLLPKRRPALLPLLARQLGVPFWKKHEAHYLMQDEDLTKPIDVQFCSGAFFMMRTDVFKRIGGFDEKYFMYVEDADITQKALAYGRAVYLPQVEAIHEWHRAARSRPRQFIWQMRSMLRYFRKWGFRLK